MLLVLFLSYSIHTRIKPYLRNDLLGVGDDNADLDLDAVKRLARRQQTMSKEERRAEFSFVNTGSRSRLRERSSAGRSASSEVELVDRVSPSRHVPASNRSDVVARRQGGRSAKRPTHAKLTRVKTGRLDRLLKMDYTDHAAFDQSTSEGVWASLGVQSGSPDDGFAPRNSGNGSGKGVSAAFSSTLATSKKFLIGTIH